MGIIQAIMGIVRAGIGTIGGGSVGLSFVGRTVITAAIYGGAAISRSLASKKEAHTSSPTYQFNILQTQTNNQLPIPILYGENKIAGNRLWQQYRNNNTVIDRIVAFSEGEIEAINDIRLNDIPINEIGGITYRLYYGTKNQITDQITGNTLEERVTAVGSLKNIAYIAISVCASEKIRSDYNLTVVAKGRKVRVYTTEDDFTVKYSNNPAWCLLDFLCAYNGCGIGLDEHGARNSAKINEFIDINSFIEAARFCDELVDGKPRFTFNMIFDSQTQRHEIIEEIKKACRGALIIKGKRLQFKIDSDAIVSKTIFAKDIIPGSEQFSTIPKDENYDKIIIKYRSKDNEWAICEAIAEKEEFDNIPPIEHTVNVYGVSDHDQASRLAWYYLNKVAKERYFGYFETDYRAFDLEIGDIISLNDNLMKFTDKLVKVTRLIDKNDGSFGVHWREYNPSVYSDTKGSNEPMMRVMAIQNTECITPSDVSGFYATQILNTINLGWTSVSGADITYEIRCGESWDVSSIITTNSSANSIIIPITSTGLKKYFIKAKSKYNFYSINPAVAISFVEQIPSVNTIIRNNLLSDNFVEKSGVKIYNNSLNPRPTATWPKIMPKETHKPYANSQKKWCIFSSNDENSFTTRIFDIKDLLTSIVYLNYNFVNKTESQYLSLEARFSKNKLSWTPWQTFGDGSYEFRYYQLRCYVENSGSESFLVNNMVLSIDVPDRDEYYKNIQISSAQSGITIDFATHEQSKLKKDFLCVPSIVANITGSQVGYCVITQKSPKSLTIKTYSDTNTPIAATCDIHAKGY